MKNKIIVLLVVVAIAIVAFFSFGVNKENDEQKIIMGSQGTDTQVWEHIAKSKEAKKMGLKITVKDFTDSASLDKGVADGKLDVNAFQSYAYLVTYNEGNKDGQLAVLGTTYIQPMGLYSKRYSKLGSIPDGSTLAIANDPAAESRGLKLLASAGLLQLKQHGSNVLVTPQDIKKNPHNYKITTILSTNAPSVLKDNSVAAVAIDNTTAQEAGLNVFKDSIYHEKLEQNTKANVNVIVTTKKNANNATYKKLVKLYHNKAIQKYIQKKFPGKVEVNKSVKYLKN